MIEVTDPMTTIGIGTVGVAAGWFWGALSGYADGWTDGRAGKAPRLQLFLSEQHVEDADAEAEGTDNHSEEEL